MRRILALVAVLAGTIGSSLLLTAPARAQSVCVDIEVSLNVNGTPQSVGTGLTCVP